LDETRAEELYSREPVESLTPEKLFERRWAFTLVERVLARLKQEYASGARHRARRSASAGRKPVVNALTAQHPNLSPEIAEEANYGLRKCKYKQT
jgi:hypothetical protein